MCAVLHTQVARLLIRTCRDWWSAAQGHESMAVCQRRCAAPPGAPQVNTGLGKPRSSFSASTGPSSAGSEADSRTASRSFTDLPCSESSFLGCEFGPVQPCHTAHDRVHMPRSLAALAAESEWPTMSTLPRMGDVPQVGTSAGPSAPGSAPASCPPVLL